MANEMIHLNNQQQNAIATMLEFLNSDKSAFTLKGYAGTGKSTTIQFLLDQLAADGVKRKIFFTAPTHKAVKVLRHMAVAKGIDDRVTFSTIHSLLGLKIVYRGDKQELKPAGRRANDPLRDAGRAIIVVDECSMIGAELFEHIAKAVRHYDGIQYIFMGDPAQLPPVGEKESPTFEQTEARAELTMVMRQRGENPVLGACTDLREAWARGDKRLPALIAGMAENAESGVSIMAGTLFNEWMPAAFSHENFDANPDRFRVVAWRNDTVTKINNMLHALRYPGCASWLAEGEPVTFVKPAMAASLVDKASDVKDDEILVQTDFEGEVISCVESAHPRHGMPCWLTKILVEDGRELEFYALDYDGIIERDTAMRQIATRNRQAEKEKQSWWPYYDLAQSFAEIRPAYCMTAHKSQGSTFENVFVDVMDIWANPNKSEAMQCLYVACSRASHHLIVNATGG